MIENEQLTGTCPPSQPEKCRFNGEEQKESPTNAGKENIDSGQCGTRIHECYAQCKKNPSNCDSISKIAWQHKTISPMSLPTPALSTTIPTVVSNNFNSVKILHNTGNAVIEYATPVNNIKYVNLMLWSMNSLYTAWAMPAPIAKGRTMPARATMAERRALRLTTVESISSPTRNRKSTSPMLATRDKYGREARGNTCSVKPGIRPNAVGPFVGDEFQVRSRVFLRKLTKEDTTQHFRDHLGLAYLTQPKGQ